MQFRYYCSSPPIDLVHYKNIKYTEVTESTMLCVDIFILQVNIPNNLVDDFVVWKEYLLQPKQIYDQKNN